MTTLPELDKYHNQIVAMLDQHKSLRLIAFLLECDLADLWQYIKDVLEYEVSPAPKQYPVPTARTWQPWHRVVIEVQLREDGSDASAH